MTFLNLITISLIVDYVGFFCDHRFGGEPLARWRAIGWRSPFWGLATGFPISPSSKGPGSPLFDCRLFPHISYSCDIFVIRVGLWLSARKIYTCGQSHNLNTLIPKFYYWTYKYFRATYSLQRDPRYFSPLPDPFLTERWLSQDQRLALLR